jgi:carbon monoxide dehydrogenase subunit G
MRIDSTFQVPVGLDAVWDALLDIERIAPCLPGASIDENRGDGQYGGSMRVKLGPVTSTFRGTLRVATADQEGRRAVIEASARDTRGQGAAAATITSTLEPDGDGTRVAVQTDMKLAGTAAQFGRGVVTDVSQKLMAEFADRLADEIRNPSARAAAAAPGAQQTPAPAPSAGVSSSQARAPEDDVLDLTAAGRDAVLKRAVPALAGLAALLVLVGLMRGRRPRRAPLVVINRPVVIIGGRPRRRRRKRS